MIELFTAVVLLALYAAISFASEPVDIGTGTTVTFASSAFTAEITRVGFGGITREAVDVTHMESEDAREYDPADLVDSGELNIEGHFNPDTDPPVDEAAETVTVTWPSGATWAGTGFLTNYEADAVVEEKMTFSATVKWTGKITVTPAA